MAAIGDGAHRRLVAQQLEPRVSVTTSFEERQRYLNWNDLSLAASIWDGGFPFQSETWVFIS